jgi:4-amino-4-deoxy-L-arabinose transferase-like glycosyltransferase
LADWLQQTLAVLPLALWVYIGMGIFPALWLLPRRDWQQTPLVLCLSFAFGSAILTAWMFILGTIGAAQQTSLLRFDLIFAGTTIFTAFFGMLAWRKYRHEGVLEKAEAGAKPLLAFDEKLLLLLIAIAIMLRGLTTAYWTFNAYDTLWVFGYQGRLFSLLGYIPESIGYYPPFLSLQYAFMQLAVGGMDDHAARIVVWFLHVGGILAAYVAGTRLFNRRTGIILAALWTLYPHVGEWAHIGDLEIPLAFLFTLAATFFLMAWLAKPDEPRRQYAVIAGLAFGIAMWTKPTAGAFVWGVALLVMADLVRVRGNWRVWLPRFEMALMTGLACLPLGAVWYVRNILLGHNAIDFPNPVWLTLARRSGDLFGFGLLFLALLLVYLTLRYWQHTRKNLLLAWAGLVLVFLGLLPSMPFINPARMNPPDSYLTLPETLTMFVGLMILSGAVYRNWRGQFSPNENWLYARFGWIFLLALPYFVTWFYSYSYHYRLLFAVVPLLLLPSAALLAGLLPEQRIKKWHVWGKMAYAAVLVMLALPGIGATILNVDRYPDFLWVNRYPDDTAKYKSQNPDMMLLVEQLQYFINDHQRQPVIMAPGEQRLPFFFPLVTMTTDELPNRLDDLAGYTHFLYGTHARWRYNDAAISPETNQIVAALGRPDVLKPIVRHSDSTFSYDLYEIHLENRQQVALDYLNPFPQDVILGDFVRLEGFAFSNSQFAGTTIAYDLALQVLKTPDKNYQLRFEMVHVADGKIYGQWETCIAPSDFGCYNSKLWDAGEYIITSGRIIQTDTQTFITGDYELRISFVALDANSTPIAAPVTVDNQIVPAYQMPGFRYG